MMRLQYLELTWWRERMNNLSFWLLCVLRHLHIAHPPHTHIHTHHTCVHVLPSAAHILKLEPYMCAHTRHKYNEIKDVKRSRRLGYTEWAEWARAASTGSSCITKSPTEPKPGQSNVATIQFILLFWRKKKTVNILAIFPFLHHPLSCHN